MASRRRRWNRWWSLHISIEKNKRLRSRISTFNRKKKAEAKERRRARSSQSIAETTKRKLKAFCFYFLKYCFGSGTVNRSSRRQYLMPRLSVTCVPSSYMISNMSVSARYSRTSPSYQASSLSRNHLTFSSVLPQTIQTIQYKHNTNIIQCNNTMQSIQTKQT